MKDHTLKGKDGVSRAVSELSLAELNNVLRTLDHPSIKFKGKATKESLRERVLIELTARELDI